MGQDWRSRGFASVLLGATDTAGCGDHSSVTVEHRWPNYLRIVGSGRGSTSSVSISIDGGWAVDHGGVAHGSLRVRGRYPHRMPRSPKCMPRFPMVPFWICPEVSVRRWQQADIFGTRPRMSNPFPTHPMCVWIAVGTWMFKAPLPIRTCENPNIRCLNIRPKVRTCTKRPFQNDTKPLFAQRLGRAG